MSFLGKIEALAVSVIFMMGTVGCMNEKDYSLDMDPIPMEICIRVSDANGNNLLDPLVAGSVAGNPITITFQNRTYMRTTGATGELSLTSVMDYQNVPIAILFGNIDGTKKIDNLPLVIGWGDDTSSTLTIYQKYSKSSKTGYSLERHIWYDGKDWYNKDYVPIVKE